MNRQPATWALLTLGLLLVNESVAHAAPLWAASTMPRNPGLFLGFFKLFIFGTLFFIWIATCAWFQNDTKGLGVYPEAWNSGVVIGGLLGLGSFFFMPLYVVSLLMFLLLFLTPTLSYIFGVRNPRVPEDAQVLTPDHLHHLMVDTFARIGINLTANDEEATEGPAVQFFSKTVSGRARDSLENHQAEGSSGFMAAKQLMWDAVQQRATDIHLEPTGPELVGRFRIDGILHSVAQYDRGLGDALLNVYKVVAAMDITERRKPQDGSFGAQVGKKSIDLRVATSGSANGEKMVLRLLDAGSGIKRLPQLGMSKELIKKITDIVEQPHGMLLCCGPTGAGKSTTLYACLQEIDRFSRNVITIEDPVEYHLDGLTQIEINTKGGQTFANSLRSILRQDPDVILVGEIRDAETATIACQAAQTGHMVFSTVHANDTITTIYRLLDLEVDPSILGTALSAILAQRLARRLCDDCKVPYKPSDDEREKLKLGNEQLGGIFAPPPQPCERCSGTGYFGRTGIFEFLTVTEKMRDLIRDKAGLRDLRAEAVHGGTRFLIKYATKLVSMGITSPAEVLRVAK